MIRMPEKNPDLLASIAAWWALHQASIHAMFLSMAVAVVRVIYGGGKLRQMILEAVLCGLATLSLIPLLEWLGLPQSMASFIGGMVGFLGVDKLRDLAEQFGRRQVSK
ncbi:MAG: phage holin, lambda family [Gammaproteobacteria bacterium]|nr:phage holin, lambda family [Gammaproteobacteria bacterium]